MSHPAATEALSEVLMNQVFGMNVKKLSVVLPLKIV